MAPKYLRNLKSDIRLRHPTFPWYLTFKTLGTCTLKGRGTRAAFGTKSEMEIIDDGYKWIKYGRRWLRIAQIQGKNLSTETLSQNWSLQVIAIFVYGVDELISHSNFIGSLAHIGNALTSICIIEAIPNLRNHASNTPLIQNNNKAFAQNLGYRNLFSPFSSVKALRASSFVTLKANIYF